MKTQTPVKQPKQPFYKKKAFLWSVGSIVGVVLLIILAFRVSPWPGALVIRAVFNSGGEKTLQALEKHTPSVAITTIANQQYHSGDSDAMLDVYFPANTESSAMLPTIIWTHGGAWLSGDKSRAAPYYKLLAAEGFTVIALNYSLAPEHTYPTPVHQLSDAYTYIQSQATRFHVDTGKFVLAGDSAGSQLSSQMAAIITNPQYASELNIAPTLKPSQLRGVVLNCGIYMMDGLTEPDPALPKIVGWGDDISVWAYSGTKDFSDPVIKEMSAYYHVTKDFPATYISGGNGDPLSKAQGQPFADLLTKLGVNVTQRFFADNHTPSLPHEYQFNLDNADGQAAFTATVEFAKRVTQ
jgi:acetyl esterase/lipase